MLREAKQFGPDARGHATAKPLRPVSGRPMIDLLRDADAAFERAAAAEANGQHDRAAQEYQAMLALLAEAHLDPAKFYSTRKEFADDLAKAADAERRAHNGELSTSPIRLPAPLPDAVLAQVARIQDDYPNSFQSALDRGQRYMPQIRAKLKGAGLPEELVYVAMIESHFNEKIVSRAGAGGMWQFMPETGRIHGLRQDGYVDARYDWEAATDAAISYFSKLREHFDGNWPLAIASYNCGEYGLARAVKAAGGETEFFKLIETAPASNMIKLETKDYYPKFLAYWIVSTYPERFGFEVRAPQVEPTVNVPVRGSYALDDLEESMGLADGTLAKLNPELVRQVTPPIGEHRLAVPQASTERLAVALQTVPQYGQGMGTHKVRKGETLAAIAAKYGTTADELKQKNKLKSAKLHAGQTLKLPFAVPGAVAKGGADVDAPLVRAAKTEKAKREQAPQVVTYTVKKGDTLGRIADKNGVALDALLAQNKLTKKSQIKAGQKLKIAKAGKAVVIEESEEPAPAAPAAQETAAIEHTVAAGEYLAVIAKKYSVSVADLETWNGLEKGETIRAGQKISVKSAKGGGGVVASAKSAPEPKKSTVKVVAGDTLGKIATKNGVTTQQLMAWNKLTDKSLLKVGQELAIYGPDRGMAASSEAEEGSRVKMARADTKSARADSGAKAPAAAPKTVHTVAAGQTPTSIAKRYGVGVKDLFTWNKWNKDHVLRPGDKVVVEKK